MGRKRKYACLAMLMLLMATASVNLSACAGNQKGKEVVGTETNTTETKTKETSTKETSTKESNEESNKETNSDSDKKSDKSKTDSDKNSNNKTKKKSNKKSDDSKQFTKEQSYDKDLYNKASKTFLGEYVKALEVLRSDEPVLPDGSKSVDEKYPAKEARQFAFMDIDSDEEKELILAWRDSKTRELTKVCSFKYYGEEEGFIRDYLPASSGLKSRLFYNSEDNVEYCLRKEAKAVKKSELFEFFDAVSYRRIAPYYKTWAGSDYDRVKDEDKSYGIDVSAYQGDIDWEKVKGDGIEFAFIRIGFRGYGQEGLIKEDEKAVANIKGAKAAGLKVGVYFFSQAISEEEAVEEADFVMEVLGKAGVKNAKDLGMPVVFDPESILYDDSRTDDVTGKQFTVNSKAFCDAVEEKGFDSMIYANLMWEAYKLDLGYLADYDIWYADYEENPQTPYAFKCWQYSEKGSVAGIDGPVDLDIWIK